MVFNQPPTRRVGPYTITWTVVQERFRVSSRGGLHEYEVHHTRPTDETWGHFIVRRVEPEYLLISPGTQTWRSIVQAIKKMRS